MLFYHYCSFDTLKHILSSKSLWLTRIVKSNDEEEVKRTLIIIWSRIRDEIADGINGLTNSKTIMDNLDSQMKTDALCSTVGDEIPYAVCFSENRDLIQNWNEYGDKGRGVCLAFSHELFFGIERILPHPNSFFQNAIGWDYVYYDDDDLSKQLVPLFVNILKKDQTVMGWLTVRTTLKHYSAFIKNPSFVDEREARIVYYPNESHAFDDKTELTRSVKSDNPHCSLPWIKSNGNSALKEIILGNSCEHSKDEVVKMLNDLGINNVLVSNSGCSYRSSNNR